MGLASFPHDGLPIGLTPIVSKVGPGQYSLSFPGLFAGCYMPQLVSPYVLVTPTDPGTVASVGGTQRAAARAATPFLTFRRRRP